MSYRSARCLYSPYTLFTNAKNGPEANYKGITFDEIVLLAETPQRRSKEKASFFIPSDYLGHDGRSHAPQREHGQFWYLTLDIDNNNISEEVLKPALQKVIGDGVCLIYSTSSASTENRKWRALVPLGSPLLGIDFEQTQDAFFDLLEEEEETIICDRALARTGQPVYLPNVPPDRRSEDGSPLYYRHFLIGDGPTALDPDHRIVIRREENRAEQALIEAEIAGERTALAANSANNGALSPIEAFNATNSIEALLIKYGYGRNGEAAWQSRYQTSNSYATINFNTYWVSHSESDRKEGIGHTKCVDRRVANRRFKSRSQFCWGDAFDLFVHYEHGGDFDAAIKSVAAQRRSAAITQLIISSGKIGLENSSTETSPEDQPSLYNKANAPPDLSDDQLAIELGLAGFDREALYVKSWGKWLFWNGAIWAVDEKNWSMTLVRQFLRAKAEQLLKWLENLESKVSDKKFGDAKKWTKVQALRLRSAVTISAILRLAASNPSTAASAEQFDADPNILATPTGTVDLRTGDLRESQQADFATKMTAVGPAGKGSRPELWLRFLDRIFNGDTEVIAFIQRAAGYALTGSTAEHKLLFLYGTGRNGKSVFLNTLMGIWGPYARRAAASVFLDKMHEGHPTEVAGLRGARLVIGSELPAGKTWNEAVIKDLTGGDTLTARHMRQDFFDFKAQFTLMIAGNHQPAIRGVDEAIRSRIVLVPFEVTIPEEERDPELEAKLMQEWPEILRWCIKGTVEWYKQGLNPPHKIRVASDEYIDDEDLIGRYIEDRIVMDPNGRVSTQALRSDFKNWSTSQGIREWSQTAVTKAIKETGRFKTYKSGNERGFEGFRLRTTDQHETLNQFRLR